MFYSESQQRYIDTKLKFLADSHRPVELVGKPPPSKVNLTSIEDELSHINLLHKVDLSLAGEPQDATNDPSSTTTISPANANVLPIYTKQDGKNSNKFRAGHYIYAHPHQINFIYFFLDFLKSQRVDKRSPYAMDELHIDRTLSNHLNGNAEADAENRSLIES